MTQTNSDALSHLAVEMAEAAMAAGQASGLALLRAEMEALTQVMPGQHAPLSEADRRAREAEIEAEFDNMPI